MYQTQRIIVECNAGRMIQEGHSVRAEKKRGKIKVIEDFQDGLKHFQWIDLKVPENPVENFIIFQNEAAFQKVVCAEGRVFMLDYSGQKTFYWFQDKEESSDQETCLKINEAIGSSQTGWPKTWPQGAKGKPAVEQKVGNPQVQQLQSLTQQNPFQQGVHSQPQGILQNPFTQQSAPQQQQQQQQQGFIDYQAFAQLLEQVQNDMPSQLSLEEVFTPEFLDSISQDPQIKQELIPFLPEDQQGEEHLRANLLSPQLQQAMKALSAAINSEQFVTVMASLGVANYLPQNVNDGVEALLIALMNRARSEGQISQNQQQEIPKTEAKKEEENEKK